MCARVRRVGVLVGPDVGGRGGAELADALDPRQQVAAGGVGRVDEFEPGAELPQACDVFGRRLRVDDGDEAVAAAAGEPGERDAEVAGGRLDEDGAALEQAALLEVVEQALGGAVLERAAGIGCFQLQLHDPRPAPDAQSDLPERRIAHLPHYVSASASRSRPAVRDPLSRTTSSGRRSERNGAIEESRSGNQRQAVRPVAPSR